MSLAINGLNLKYVAADSLRVRDIYDMFHCGEAKQKQYVGTSGLLETFIVSFF